jgi:ligand-binding sensor domain-containing protein/serine phosphatase RsbU (regulator of sigma subunit)
MRIFRFVKSYLQLLFALCICYSRIHSQDIKFTHINADQGLSQSVVNCLVQDKKGFMWFGTDDGLNKYDGSEIKVYKRLVSDSLSLSNNGILALFCDKKGVLWIGTNGGGLNRYDELRNKFIRYEHVDGDSTSLSNNVVRSIYEDNDGVLWVGTEEGLNKFNPATGKFNIYGLSHGLKTDRIWGITQSKDNLIWLATYGGGIHSFDKKSNTFKQYIDVGTDGELIRKNSHKIRFIHAANDGKIWLGSHGASLISFNQEKESFYYHTIYPDEGPVSVTSLVEDKNGIIWIGTNRSLVQFNKNTNQYISFEHNEGNPFSLSNNSVRTIVEDEAGSIWIGTDGGGVSTYHKAANKFGHFSKKKNTTNTLLSNKVYAFTEDADGNIWIGTYGGGLCKINRKTGIYSSFLKENNLMHDNILSLYFDSDNLIWFGTWGGGLNYYDTKTNRFGKGFQKETDKQSLSNNNVLSIVEDSQKRLWIATLNGLSVYDKRNNTFKNIGSENGLSSNVLLNILLDKKEHLWIGTAGGGLNMIDTKTFNVKQYIKADENDTIALSDNTVNCMLEDSKGYIWIGTAMGLNKLDPATGKFEHYYESDGLPNDYIYGILEDENGFLWISTNKGISKFNPSADANNRNRFRNYYVLDGLQANEFNQGAYFKSKSGEMFFGGHNGFNVFYPKNIIDNKHIPPVYITSFKLFGKDVQLDTGIINKKYIELSYKDNFFSFEFVALDYVLPEKNTYSYMMEGLDQDWNPVSNRRFANYTDLGGGNYVFRVRGSNNDGVWNEEGASIQIRITPPFWKTKIFYAACIIFTILSVFLFIKLRTRQIQKEKEILEIKVAERTYELAQKNKDIMDSIQYAKRIQEAILPDRPYIFKHLANSFILYKPKDIVSGDFYWFYQKNGKKIIAAVDCTGHGVPGAFMSMIGHNLLNQIVIEKNILEPARILSELNNGVQEALKQKDDNGDTRDGMDVSLCLINEDNTEIEYAGAYRPLYIISQNQIEKIEGNKFPIGGAQLGNERVYTNHRKKVKKGDTAYMFSDGYVDQFGGDKGKKFMAKRLQELLIEISTKNMQEQREILDNTINTWKGSIEQVDDILVIGIGF